MSTLPMQTKSLMPQKFKKGSPRRQKTTLQSRIRCSERYFSNLTGIFKEIIKFYRHFHAFLR